MQSLFSWDYNHKALTTNIKDIIDNLGLIDKKIEQAAPLWPIKQINRIDLAILRLSFFEVIIDKGAPIKVVIDEAVELAKEYGSDTSPSFVNGVLGKLVEEKGKDDTK